MSMEMARAMVNESCYLHRIHPLATDRSVSLFDLHSLLFNLMSCYERMFILSYPLFQHLMRCIWILSVSWNEEKECTLENALASFVMQEHCIIIRSSILSIQYYLRLTYPNNLNAVGNYRTSYRLRIIL